jgi:uncharacterized membrane protein YoaT (DUF817 family)
VDYVLFTLDTIPKALISQAQNHFPLSIVKFLKMMNDEIYLFIYLNFTVHAYRYNIQWGEGDRRTSKKSPHRK